MPCKIHQCVSHEGKNLSNTQGCSCVLLRCWNEHRSLYKIHLDHLPLALGTSNYYNHPQVHTVGPRLSRGPHTNERAGERIKVMVMAEHGSQSASCVLRGGEGGCCLA